MKKQQGFTLIELMIVVAIVAILAAIALPAAQDFLARSKVSEALAAAGTCKTSVSEYAASEGKLPANLKAAGCSNTETKYVAELDVTEGVISTKLQNINAEMNGKLLILTPNSDTNGSAAINGEPIVAWTCTTDTDQKQYVPASCRGTGP